MADITAHDIFNRIAGHMQEGLKVHDQLVSYYNFLGMDGFAEEHARHYDDEVCNYRKLSNYYLTFYGMLLNPPKSEDPVIIPTSWYRHVTDDVDSSTKRNAIESGFKAWRDWEHKTKLEYEKSYKQLMDIGETSAAFFVKGLLEDVLKEIETINKVTRKLKNEEFDLKSISAMQEQLIKKNQNSEVKRNTYNTFDEYY